MPQVRPNTSAKWMRRTASAGQEYTEGIKSPRADWAQSATAAAPIQAAAIQEAIRLKRYEKGIAKAGSAKWLNGALTKGAVRFGPGVAEGEGAYREGVQPYLDTIASTSLPPRGPAGDPKNIERVRVLAAALRAKKMSM